MNKQLMLTGGAILIGASLLIGVIFGWLTVLAIFIGLSSISLMALANYEPQA